MDSDYEERTIEYEHARNEAMDKWFNARPHLERDQRSERLFEGGFRVAYEAREYWTCPDCSSRVPVAHVGEHQCGD